MADEGKVPDAQGNPVTPAPATPAEPPKYQPPDEDQINKQAAYYARDFKRGGNAFLKLMDSIEEHAGETIFTKGDAPAAPVSDPAVNDRITNMERENARLRAGLKYGLDENDLSIIDGTPAEIDAKAKYMSERLKAAAPAPATPGAGTPPAPGVVPPVYEAGANATLEQIAASKHITMSPAIARAYGDLQDTLKNRPPYIPGG